MSHGRGRGRGRGRGKGGKGGRGQGRGGPRIPQPDYDAFNVDIAALDERIKELNADLKVIQKQQKDNETTLRRLQTQGKERNKKLEPMIKVMANLRATRADCLSTLRAKARQIDSFKSNTAATLGGESFDRRHIEERIRRLKWHQQTVSMSLAEEKEIVGKISKLREALKKTQSLDKLYDDKKALHKQLKAIEAKISKEQKTLDKAKQSLDASDMNKKINTIRSQKPILESVYRDKKKQIDAAYKEKKNRYDAHYEAKREYKRLLDEWYEEKRAAKKQADALWREQEAHRRKQEEEELAKQKPWLEEIALCDLLINFCKRYATNANGNKSVKANGHPRTGQARQINADGLGQAVRKKDNSNRYTRKGKHTRGSARQKKPKVKTIVHTPDTICGFIRFDISRPHTSEDIAATIQALREKRDYYDKLPRKSRKSSGGSKSEAIPSSNVEIQDANAYSSAEAKTAEGEQKTKAVRSSTVDANDLKADAAITVKSSENKQQPTASDGIIPPKANAEIVGNTLHKPFASVPGADKAFNEYVTYSDDPTLGQPCPSLESLDYVQGDAIAVGSGRVSIVFFWGKYLKWQCWPIVVGMCEINEKFPQVDVVGIAADKKRKDVERFIEKGECRADCALAFDSNWVIKDAFRKLMKVGAMAVPCAFLINSEGKIVWRQAYSAGYPFGTLGFHTQLKHVLAHEKIESHGPNPNPNEDDEDVEEAVDVFATQEVKDAIW